MLRPTILAAALVLAFTPVSASAAASKTVEAFISVETPQDSRGEAVYETGKGPHHPSTVPVQIVLAHLKSSAEPLFPLDARRAHAAGTVKVGGVIAADGHFIDLQIENNTVVGNYSSDLGQSALAAARQYRFKPATLDGKPVAMKLKLKIVFQIF